MNYSERQKLRLSQMMQQAAAAAKQNQRHTQSQKRQTPVVPHPPKQRPKPIKMPPPVPEVPHLIFISGGIGDIISLESFMPEYQRSQITTIYYGTRKHSPIQSIFAALPNYTNLKNHIVAWADFNNFWCFHEKRGCIRKMVESNIEVPSGLNQALDWSIGNVFPLIKTGKIPFVGSSLLLHNVASIEKFNLPETYAAVCPYSNDKRDPNRDFSDSDWDGCRRILRSAGIKGVVINEGNDQVPECDELINLNNQTNFLESVEILKKSVQYIGIDSCLSTLAAQLFKPECIIIKSVNRHCMDCAKCYFAPHETFPFLIRSIA